MSGDGSAGDSNGPLFVLATRLYVHYKFKTRKSFDPSAALIDDDYAHEVLTLVRAVKDHKLFEMANAFEQMRFPAGDARSRAPEASKQPASAPLMDLQLESAG